MTTQFELNRMVLVDGNLASIDFDRAWVSPTEHIGGISVRSSNSMHFLTRDGRGIDESWTVEVNGCSWALLPRGIKTSLTDGDRVTFKLPVICGG